MTTQLAPKARIAEPANLIAEAGNGVEIATCDLLLFFNCNWSNGGHCAVTTPGESKSHSINCDSDQDRATFSWSQ